MIEEGRSRDHFGLGTVAIIVILDLLVMAGIVYLIFQGIQWL